MMSSLIAAGLACWIAQCVGKWFYLSVVLTDPHATEA
jgi:hypothetical protein